VILEDMGLHYRWLTIPPRLTWQAIWKNHEETKELRKELSARNIFLFPYGLWMGWKKMKACEALEQLAMKVRPIEMKRGETQKRLKKVLSWVDEAKTPRVLEKVIQKGKTFLQEIEQDRSRLPFKVAIVGELYTVMDPHINRGVEQKLGELGVEVTRTSWFSTHILRSLRRNKANQTSERIRFFEASKAYLGYDVGAECNVSVGEAILRSQEGYDGVVHLMPFACMPETTASGILTQVGKDWNIPILTLILDEQEIEGRIQTLLEAFVEMLEWKRRAT
jgi:predicted nucleotide-binding protein (sugar kinase/HSP70/actin superfamily)